MAGERRLDQIHASVLLQECMEHLDPRPGCTYVDATLGLGGHTEALLERSAPDGRVVAFEWDEGALALARQRLGDHGSRLILLDAGMSSLQLDMGGRGFSFQQDEPLDMRMDTRRPVTAAGILATSTEQELADIFYYYGEERQARPIAAAIVRGREKESIRTSKQLAVLVARAVPKRFHPRKIHIATKVFQALRIAVNTELENLARALDDGVRFLMPGGAFCVISFHSLEDRLVKRRFIGNELLDVETSKPVVASPQEVAANPRSRSARLRVARRNHVLTEGIQ